MKIALEGYGMKRASNNVSLGIGKLIYFFRERTVSPLIGFLLLRSAVARLKERGAQCKTVEDHVNLAYTFSLGLIHIRPAQVKWEISQLMKSLAKVQPKVALEIGTAGGGTLYLISKVCAPDATIISVDLPAGLFGGGHPNWRNPLYESFASDRQTIHLIRGDSHESSTVRRIEGLLKGRRIDFLFIDGDHTYEGVKRDFELYSKFVDQGIIALHDIVPGPYEAVGEVPKFWSEIKREFKHREIVKNFGQGGWGIGIIYVK